MAATISKFISSLDGEYDDLAQSLPSDFMPKLLNRLIPFLKAQDSRTITTRRSTKRTVSVVEALKLSEKALSLDEFLSLLRLTDFKQDLLEMDIGRTIIEISETCVEGSRCECFLERDKYDEALAGKSSRQVPCAMAKAEEGKVGEFEGCEEKNEEADQRKGRNCSCQNKK